MNHPLDSATVLLHAVTGSQAIGTAAESSDVDITRVRALSTEQLAGLFPVPAGDHQRQQINGPLDIIDIDIAAFLRQVVKGSAKHFETLYSPLAAPRCEAGALLVTARTGLITQDAVRYAYRGYIVSLARKVFSGGPKVEKDLRVLHKLLTQAGQLWTTGTLDLRAAGREAPEEFAAAFLSGDTDVLASLLERVTDMFATTSPLPTDTAGARDLAADLVRAGRSVADKAA